MRLISVLFVVSVLAACERQAPPVAAAGSTSCQPPPLAMLPASTPLNSTRLGVEPLTTALSGMTVHFATPELGQALTASDPRSFEVRLVVEAPEADALGVDVALDDQRPRRLAVAQPMLGLGQLLSVDADLAQGEHWLFAAPVLASGLVPRGAPGLPRAAVARRFFVGSPAHAGRNGPSGAVWLRKPEGTYNGPRNKRVVFDAFSFNATGAPLEPPCTIALEATQVRGELRLTSPFVALDVPSGDYEVTLSAAGAAPRLTHFTVNSELGVGP